jgi:rubrerythrin
MGSDIAVQFQESIRLEQNVFALYLHYAQLFPEDQKFWLGISLEEERHSQVLNRLYTEFLPQGLLPDGIFDPDIRRLKRINYEVEKMVEAIERGAPIDKKRLYLFALEIEQSSGEHAYQEVMTRTSNFEAVRLAQDLNKGDKDHAERIKLLLDAL